MLSRLQSMPLGSIAEWRARIGSSWCALGWPFKTRSPFRGGAGQLQTPLPLDQVVTMMMILIIFTAINLVFHIVWTTGHYHTHLGECHAIKIPSVMTNYYQNLMHYFGTFHNLDITPFKSHWSTFVPISTLHHLLWHFRYIACLT